MRLLKEPYQLLDGDVQRVIYFLYETLDGQNRFVEIGFLIQPSASKDFEEVTDLTHE